MKVKNLVIPLLSHSGQSGSVHRAWPLPLSPSWTALAMIMRSLKLMPWQRCAAGNLAALEVTKHREQFRRPPHVMKSCGDMTLSRGGFLGFVSLQSHLPILGVLSILLGFPADSTNFDLFALA